VQFIHIQNHKQNHKTIKTQMNCFLNFSSSFAPAAESDIAKLHQELQKIIIVMKYWVRQQLARNLLPVGP
jgi:hypothetical protein